MERTVQRIEGDPLAHLDEKSRVGTHSQLSGCFTVLPYVEVCYDWNGSQVKVCLRVGGIEVGCATLDAANPSITLGANLLLVKAEVTLRFDVSTDCLSYEATGCYRSTPWSDWECETASGEIICF